MAGKEALEDLLRKVRCEPLGKDLLEAGVAGVGDGAVSLTYPYPAASEAAAAKAELEGMAEAAGLGPVEVEARVSIAARMFHGGAERVRGVKNVIAVSSAKGGVGKSEVSVGLALALAAEGASAGVLDADIYGPSVPVMLGGGRPGVDDSERLVPLSLHGVRALSMGHLVDAGQAIVWRAPMVIKALRQLVFDADWEGLDFLVLDMPPGTGDVQLSVAQQVPVTGAVVVTTPQELALADAERGVRMFERVSIPVLGYVANMTHFACPGCGARHEPFGPGSGERLSRELGLELLAELPIDPAVGAAVPGEPAFARDPGGAHAQALRSLAAKIGVALLDRPVDRGSAFPKIVPG